MPLFPFTCGCATDSRSVSLPVSLSLSHKSKSPQIKHVLISKLPDDDDDAASTSSTPSTFSDLIRQLEKNVIEWTPPPPQKLGNNGGKVEESVAVETESDDPLRDFRRSMLQMIIEKEIVGELELRELLHRFLDLNSTEYHAVILTAFGEIWNEVFKGYVNTPDLLRQSRANGVNNWSYFKSGYNSMLKRV